MLKKAATYLLFLVFSLQIAGNFAIYLGFKINQNYIASNLCENKGNVKMHCNGHCQLMKAMQENEKRENTPTVLKQDVVDIYFEPSQSDGQDIHYITLAKGFSYSESPIKGLQISIFRPPKA